MEPRRQEVFFLEGGGVREWMDALGRSDAKLLYSIEARLERVEQGNFGDWALVGDGVFELRFMKTGPGCRIYFGRHDDIVVLLRAGTKATQDADIKAAKKLWAEYDQDG